MIEKNQTIKLANLINLNSAAFETVKSMKETIAKGRISNIIEAYKAGTQNELPAIQVAGTDGSIIDGRHRMFVAWLMGATEIQADIHY